MPSLFVIRGNDQGVKRELDSAVLRIGREASNSFQLHDQEVSRHHAEVQRCERTFTLVDLDSSNGTFVNGQRISQ